MSTRPWSVLVAVLCCAGTLFVGIAAARQTRIEGVHYKPKHLEKARGTLVYPDRRHRDTATFSDPGGGELIPFANQENYPVQRSYMLAIRPVPVDVYREAMTDARTHYDVFRIFLPLQMTDAEIDRMLWSQDAVSEMLTIISRGSGGAMPHFTPEQWKEWEKTKLETDEHGRCGKPVPQVVRVREILARGDEEYFPSCVLRYRCRRDAGCCQHEFQVCSATKSEKIEKTVLVAKVHSQDHRVHYQNLTMKTFTVENDTECGCVQIVTPVPSHGRPLSLREKPCPHPFVFDMDSQSCRCRDASFKRSCKRILRGEKELLPSDIRCIREDKCRALNICSYGNFDMASYQCPKKPDTFISSGDAKRIEKGRHRG